MPPQMNAIDESQFISIVIFKALGKTYKEDATRFFRAKFFHSAHYVVYKPFPREGFIDGFFSPGLVYLDPPGDPNPLADDSENYLPEESDIEHFVYPALVYLSCPLVLPLSSLTNPEPQIVLLEI